MGGDKPAPSTTESTAHMLEAYTRYLPELMRVTNAELPAAAQTQVDIAQQTSPALAELQARLYGQYAPEMAGVANNIARDQALSQAGTDAQVLQGPGTELVRSARELQREEDPEYYQNRTLLSNRLGDLVNSIDLTGGISGGEREELQRAQNRQNQQRGIATNPSQTAALENAMQFGQAAYQRQGQQQDRLGQALNVGSGMLPTLRSGTDVFQVATGRSSQPNNGLGQFQGVNTQLGQSGMDTTNNFLNQTGQLTQQANQINSQRRDSLDRFNETWSGVVGSL